MVRVDTVYQRVLVLANKEQRGYITPQEFNLYANQAQMEIFEQYFYDLNQTSRATGNDTVYADVDDMLEEKLQIFEFTDGVGRINNNTIYVGAGGGGVNKQLPDYIYRISRIELNNIDCEILNTKDFNEARRGGPLVLPTNDRPIVNIRGNIMRAVARNGDPVTPTGVIYFRRPNNVNWTYLLIGYKAMYDANPNTVDFELHPSEETELVYKILKFAGISMKALDIMRAGQIQEQSQVQQEKQ